MTQTLPFPIRRGMDVFSIYQNQYIGAVIEVRTAGLFTGGIQAGRETEPAFALRTPSLAHEEGASISPTEYAGTKRLGEEMGPFPTAAVGNTGPAHQSAAREYATEPGQTLDEIAWFTVRPGRLNLGPFTRPLWIPVSAIRSISMERIVLDVQWGAIPGSWWRRPSS